MNEVMTLEEIMKTFDSEWVLVAEPELTPALEVISGRSYIIVPTGMNCIAKWEN